MVNEDNYSQYCWNRLPCGLCRLTNAMCPLKQTTFEITSVYAAPYPVNYGNINLNCDSGYEVYNYE